MIDTDVIKLHKREVDFAVLFSLRAKETGKKAIHNAKLSHGMPKNRTIATYAKGYCNALIISGRRESRSFTR